MKTIHISSQILAAMNTIAAAGHGVEIGAETRGGNNHTSTYLVICCRKPGEAAYSRRLLVKHISSYGSKFDEWVGVDDDFGDMCYETSPRIDGLVQRASALA